MSHHQVVTKCAFTYLAQYLLASTISIPRCGVDVINSGLEGEEDGVDTYLLVDLSIQIPKRPAAE